MASGHLTALIGRTHGCTDQLRDVKILLANSEPSTHGTSRRAAAQCKIGRKRGEADIQQAAMTAPNL